MKEIYINADDYNSDSIKTIQGNNNAEEYKIYLQYDNEKIDLTGKTVNLGFLRVGSTEGDIIENLNVTNPKEGEITLKITNKISKRNGTYSCQLAILGEGDFLEHTATFTLTVENNIFSDITKAIADSKDFTYLENILDKASKLSEKLKENTSSATNANSNLESNITEANNINSKLLENTSTATSLNSNLESNINLAKEVKETIKDLDTKNIEATEKIQTLTGLNNKAQELSNNIQQGLPLNSELVKNTEEAKVANTNLLATNQEATTKNTELQASLEKTKEFINGLDGSQNIPQLRLDVTELQNGLKSNQALAYQGSSISANDTLEGRTECMRIGGRTLVNLSRFKSNKWNIYTDKTFATKNIDNSMIKPSTVYTFKIFGLTNKFKDFVIYASDKLFEQRQIKNNSVLTSKSIIPTDTYVHVYAKEGNELTETDLENIKIILVEGDFTNIELEYFEGIKSFGEQEGNKISILSHNKNLLNTNEFTNNKFLRYEDGTIQEPREGRCITEKFYELPENIVLSSSENLWKGFWIYDVNFKFIRNVESQNDVLVTKQSNEKYYRIGIQELRESILSKKVQLEERTIKTEYEPYKDDKKDILIKEPLRENDVLYEDNGQVKVYRDVKQYTFTGDENITIHQQINGLTRFRVAIPNNSKIDQLAIKFCDNLKINSDDRFFSNIQMSIGTIVAEYQTNNNCYMIFNSDTTTVEQAKIKLKELRPTIVYQLAEPTVEVVENCVDIDLDTFGEKTYFNILNSLPGTLDFKVPSNIASIVQNTAREVNNIWDVINNLLVPSLIDINKNVAMSTIKNNLK
ncbi:BppU family phage baseplate upper protein [Clostridium perfringens]